MPVCERLLWEMELQMAVNHQMWVPESKLRSSARAEVLLTTEPSFQTPSRSLDKITSSKKQNHMPLSIVC